MKINELIKDFSIFITNEEKKLLTRLKENSKLLSEFTEHEQFVIEGMVRKSLVIKIGNTNPKVIANEL
jgi:hypothetical protein